MDTMQGKLDKDTGLDFALAGNAILTVESGKTGTRYTYRVRKGKAADSPYFVGVLSGPDNTADYTYLGTIFNRTDYRHGRKSTINQDAPSARAFAYVWEVLQGRRQWPDALTVYHEGRCGKCARRLTVPESVTRGLGPECSGEGYSKAKPKATRKPKAAPQVAPQDDDQEDPGNRAERLLAEWECDPRNYPPATPLAATRARWAA